MLTRERTERLVALCSDLIKRRSTSGAEEEVVRFLEKRFRDHGCPDVHIDGYGSITARFRGTKPGKTLLFDSHVDTVPVPAPDQWTHDPFGGVLSGDRIFGRGSSDMKGALAAVLLAVESFLEDTGGDFPGTIAISGTVHEESFEGIAARSIGERVKPDLVIIGEATELNLVRGQRGRAEIVVETFGRPAHSANPGAGVNAVYAMMELAGAIRNLPVPSHPSLGLGILELTDIISSPYPGLSVVPDYCRATFDRRLLVGETRGSTLQPILDLIRERESGNREFRARVSYAEGRESCYTGADIQAERFYPGWLYGENEAFVLKALQGLKGAGLDPDVRTYSFCTNGSHYAGEAGYKTLGFGPSRENQAHVNDEYMEVSQLTGACRGYYGLLEALLPES